MDITPPRDSIGTDRLEEKNRRRSVPEADHVEPASRPPSTGEWHEQSRDPSRDDRSSRAPEEPNQSRPEGERRSGEERRQKERRQNEREVLFEVRGQHERRTKLRRREDRERASQGLEKSPRGVDIKA